MTDLAGRRTGGTALLIWGALAVALGGVAGAFLARDPALAAPVIALIVGGTAVALTIWRLEAGLVLLLVLVPLDRFGRIPGLPLTVTLFQVMLLAALFSWALRIIAHGRSAVRFSYVDIGIVALIGAALWSLPNSLAPSATLVAIGRLGFLWVFELLYANVIRDEVWLRRIINAFLIIAVLLGMLAIGQQYFGVTIGSIRDYAEPGGGVSMSRAGAFFYDPNQLGTLLCIALLMAFALVAHARAKRDVVLYGTIAGLAGVAMATTLSRTAWVGAAVGLVLVVLTAPPKRRLLAGTVLAAAVLVAGIIASPVLVRRALSVGDVNSDLSVSTRYYMTVSTVNMIKDNPVWGTGLSAYNVSYPFYRLPGSDLDVLKPHQLPLALWAEMGLAGLLAEIVAILAMVAQFWRRRPKGWTVWESIALAALVSILVQSFFQYYLYFEYLWFVLALSVVATRLARAKEDS